MIRSLASGRLRVALLVALLAGAACDRGDEIRPEDMEQGGDPIPEAAPDSTRAPDTTAPEILQPSGVGDGEGYFAVRLLRREVHRVEH